MATHLLDLIFRLSGLPSILFPGLVRARAEHLGNALVDGEPGAVHLAPAVPADGAGARGGGAALQRVGGGGRRGGAAAGKKKPVVEKSSSRNGRAEKALYFRYLQNSLKKT